MYVEHGIISNSSMQKALRVVANLARYVTLGLTNSTLMYCLLVTDIGEMQNTSEHLNLQEDASLTMDSITLQAVAMPQAIDVQIDYTTTVW